MAVGEIVGDGGHTFVLEILNGVVGHHVSALRRGRTRPREIRIGFALRQIFGAGNGQRRRARRADVVVDRQSLESGERPEHARDVKALHQLLHLCAADGGVTGGVGGRELDRPVAEHVLAVFEERQQTLFHLQAARSERAGLNGQEADTDRPGLCVNVRRLDDRETRGRRAKALENLATVHCHCFLPVTPVHSDLFYGA